jgi:transketolase
MSKELALKIRKHCLEMTNKSKASHIGSCLSIADILAVLYGKVMNYKSDEPNWEGRDRFILSKGHACAALYAVLAECGFFPIKELETFYGEGILMGHASHYVKGVDASTGSLGMGLSIGCGMALGIKQMVYVLLGDGDCDEGMTWEAVMFAGHHKLSNLVAIIDSNRLQALGSPSGILNLEPLKCKWESFGWDTRIIGGHNLEEIEKILKYAKGNNEPTCIIARTIKGKGVSYMENRVEWHYKYPNDEELNKALEELKRM